MECRSCSVDPKFHSFRFLSRLPTGEAVYYTCPALGKQLTFKQENIEEYVAHMDSASSSAWIWVFDCSGLQSYQMPTLSVLQKFIGVIQDRYKFVLKTIYLINMNWKMQIILSMTKPFVKDDMKQKLVILNSKLEVIANGFDSRIIKHVSK